MTDENPFAELADHTLVGTARVSGATQGAYLAEMMRRLKVVLEREMHAANELSGKIHTLNWAMFWYTVALGLLAAFQFGAWVRDITR
jgi:hypothetical protein